MSVWGWVKATLSADSTDEIWRNSRDSVLRQVDPHVGGQHIYERDWDALVILDACRADTFFDLVDEELDHPLHEQETVRSLACATDPWMKRTFTSEWTSTMQRSAYIVGNPYSIPNLDESLFGYFDEVHQYAWDDNVGTTPAHPVTERAVDVGRNEDWDRMIVHYMQPHFPSIPDHLGYGLSQSNFYHPEGGVEWDSVWDALKNGEISTERVQKSYRANLRYVLNELSILLENLSAESVVITSDHGNAFGEWGQYGHPASIYCPVNRLVPWVETTATDTGELMPTLSRQRRGTDDLNEKLAALGYM